MNTRSTTNRLKIKRHHYPITPCGRALLLRHHYPITPCGQALLLRHRYPITPCGRALLLRHHYLITSCALTSTNSRFFLLSYCRHCIFAVLFLRNYLYAGTIIMPPRALTSGPKPCGGSEIKRKHVSFR